MRDCQSPRLGILEVVSCAATTFFIDFRVARSRLGKQSFVVRAYCQSLALNDL